MAQIYLTETTCGHVRVHPHRIKKSPVDRMTHGMATSTASSHSHNNAYRRRLHPQSIADPPRLWSFSELRVWACMDSNYTLEDSSLTDMPVKTKPVNVNTLHMVSRSFKNRLFNASNSSTESKDPLRRTLVLSNLPRVGDPHSIPSCTVISQAAINDGNASYGGAPLNVTVDCSNAGLTSVPYPLPNMTQYL